MATVSIVLPVFNGEKFLSEAIESILNQTYADFELIIVNDGSTDTSLEKILNYVRQDRRLTVISRENRGLVTSLNEGISKARGKYIARMDCDDFSLPERLTKQVQYLETNREIAVLGTFIEAFGNIDSNTKTKTEQWFRTLISDVNAEKLFANRCPIAHPTVMFTKELWLKLGGYRDKYPYAEDYDLWCRAFQAGYKLRVFPEVLLKYRIHVGSKTSTDNVDYKNLTDVINIKLDLLQERLRNIENYLIWGAGNGGQLVKEVLKHRDFKGNLAGFVDTVKAGMLNDYKIYKPDALNLIQSSYVFVATAPGRDEVKDFLTRQGLREVVDFVCLV